MIVTLVILVVIPSSSLSSFFSFSFFHDAHVIICLFDIVLNVWKTLSGSLYILLQVHHTNFAILCLL